MLGYSRSAVEIGVVIRSSVARQAVKDYNKSHHVVITTLEVQRRYKLMG
jgi:hypothetical protein